MTSVLSMLVLGALARGEIYGDLRIGDKYVADTKLTLTCGAESADATTDKSGSFRITVKGSGKCKLTAAYQNQAPSVDVVLFDQPARYRFVLEAGADGKFVLKRV
jgi:hypothetical protein